MGVGGEEKEGRRRVRTADEGIAILFFELGKLRPVDDAGNDFAGGDGFTEVGSDDTVEFYGVVKGFFEC